MSNSPMPAALPVEIPTAARAAGYDALMQARSEGRELGQGYASALNKREGILLFFRGTLLDRAEELEAIAGVR
jgi:hypothetical protein